MEEGTPFGHYRLLDLLGRGGMGEVWRAYDTRTDRIVALKLLPEHLSRDETFQLRFRREAHSAAKLTEPHVVPIHTFGEIDGRLFVDMRLIEGRDLHAVINDGPLDPARAVLIVEQIAQALHAAHSVGLVHRDVKPSNILVADHDFAYLIDFGIARGINEVGLTDTGNMIGTWHYMAPERLRADAQVDSRSDVYALACVLHECLTGSWPFPGNSVENQIAAHLTEPPPRPSTARSDVPAELDSVVATGMAKIPDERYSTSVELAHAARAAVGDVSSPHLPLPVSTGPGFNPFLATEVASAQQKPKIWRRKAVVIPAAIVLVLAVAAAVAVPVALNREHGRQTTLAFPDLNGSYGVAVAKDKTVYVTDRSNRVLRLPAGTSTPNALPFTRLIAPFGSAVDSDGNVYVADTGRDQVLILPIGATTPQVLPFTGLQGPTGVAVGSDGTVYVSDSGNDRVLALPRDSVEASALPFTGIDNPVGVAIGDDGIIVVADSDHNRVVTLEYGETNELPFTSLTKPAGVAISADGTVYVADKNNNRVLSLGADATASTQLPFTNLRGPEGVALDEEGTVYVADSGNNRVVALAAE